MTRREKWIAGAALVGAIAGGAALMLIRHPESTLVPAFIRAQAISPQISEEQVIRALKEAGLNITGLQVRSFGEFVILRGSAGSTAADRAGEVVRQLGVTRVANLIIATTPPNDEQIRRAAERELASTGALAGCVLRVSCDKGVLRVTGTVQHELQKDAASHALRSVRGAQEVHVELTKTLGRPSV